MITPPSVLNVIAAMHRELYVHEGDPWAVYLAADAHAALLRELAVPGEARDLKVLGMPVRKIDAAVRGTIYLSMEAFQ